MEFVLAVFPLDDVPAGGQRYETNDVAIAPTSTQTGLPPLKKKIRREGERQLPNI